MIICGSWFCVENKKRKKLKHTCIKSSSPFFKWSEQWHNSCWEKTRWFFFIVKNRKIRTNISWQRNSFDFFLLKIRIKEEGFYHDASFHHLRALLRNQPDVTWSELFFPQTKSHNCPLVLSWMQKKVNKLFKKEQRIREFAHVIFFSLFKLPQTEKKVPNLSKLSKISPLRLEIEKKKK